MLPEYDFSKAICVGKYAAAMREGYTVRIHKRDGSVEVRHVPPRNDAVILDPDVRAYFPDSKAVNEALRALIKIVPKRKRVRAT